MLSKKIAGGLSSSSSASISDQTIDQGGFGAPQTAAYKLSSTGVVQAVLNGVPSTLETWLLSGSSSLYEARATIVTGSLGSGTTGSWLNLGTSREWSVTENTAEFTTSCTILVEIRLASNPGVVIDSATIELLASVYGWS